MKYQERVRIVAMKLMGQAGFVPTTPGFDIIGAAKEDSRSAKWVRDAKEIIKALDHAERAAKSPVAKKEETYVCARK